jgi:hypothetical protein
MVDDEREVREDLISERLRVFRSSNNVTVGILSDKEFAYLITFFGHTSFLG